MYILLETFTIHDCEAPKEVNEIPPRGKGSTMISHVKIRTKDLLFL